MSGEIKRTGVKTMIGGEGRIEGPGTKGVEGEFGLGE